MQQTSKAEEFADRRDSPRVELDGRYQMRLDPCDGREPVTCALLDFSVTGVRLRLPDHAVLAADVKVLIGELSHNARIVWRNGDTVGVDFIDEHHSIF